MQASTARRRASQARLTRPREVSSAATQQQLGVAASDPFETPDSFAGVTARSSRPATLPAALAAAGLEELVSIFEAQELHTLDLAADLSLDEVRRVLEDGGIKPTVGKVHRVHSALLKAQRESAFGTARSCCNETPQSVYPRSLLDLPPRDLKDAMVTRLTAESIFASLMLTISFTALIEIPTLAECTDEFGHAACDVICQCYVLFWGFAAAFFMGASIVSLGAMQLFTAPATDATTHFLFSLQRKLPSPQLFLHLSRIHTGDVAWSQRQPTTAVPSVLGMRSRRHPRPRRRLGLPVLSRQPCDRGRLWWVCRVWICHGLLRRVHRAGAYASSFQPQSGLRAESGRRPVLVGGRRCDVTGTR